MSQQINTNHRVREIKDVLRRQRAAANHTSKEEDSSEAERRPQKENAARSNRFVISIDDESCAHHSDDDNESTNQPAKTLPPHAPDRTPSDKIERPMNSDIYRREDGRSDVGSSYASLLNFLDGVDSQTESASASLAPPGPPKYNESTIADKLKTSRRLNHNNNNNMDNMSSSSIQSRRSPIQHATPKQQFDWETDLDLGSLVGSASGSSLTSRSNSTHSLSSARASSLVGGVESRLMSITLELQDKSKTLAALKSALAKAREERDTIQRKLQTEMDTRIAEQQEVHDATVKRQLSFIEKLVEDKKNLSRKIQELSKRLTNMEKEMHAKMKRQQHLFDEELKRTKQVAASSEKERRKVWEANKVKEIKESTIRGMEPEFAILVGRHRKEVEALEHRYGVDLRRKEQAHATETLAAVKLARSEADTERSIAVGRERELNQERLLLAEKTNDKRIEDIRRKYLQDMEEFKARHAREMENTRGNTDRKAQTMLIDLQEQLQEMKRRHGIELASQAERWAVEKEQWQTKMLGKLETDSRATEAAMKRRLTEERDQQLSVVVDKLNRELMEELKNTRDECETKMEALRRKTDLDLHSSAEAVESWRVKYDAQRAGREDHNMALAASETMCAQLERKVEERDRKLRDMRERVSAVDELVDQRVAVVREQHRERERALSEKIAEFEDKESANSIQAAAQERKARKDIETVRIGKEEEMEELHARVRTAMSRKDHLIEVAEDRAREAELRTEQLQELLDKQRQELLDGV